MTPVMMTPPQTLWWLLVLLLCNGPVSVGCLSRRSIAAATHSWFASARALAANIHLCLCLQATHRLSIDTRQQQAASCCDPKYEDRHRLVYSGLSGERIIVTTMSLYLCVCGCVSKKVSRYLNTGWLGSRVVSVLDSGAEGPGKQNYQAAKLAAALLRVAGVTAGLAESI